MYEIQIETGGDPKWVSLELFDYKVRYNYSLGDIGNMGARSVNHSNTYPIRNTGSNRSALNLNFYNPSALATSLNTKYKFKILRNTIPEREGTLIVGSIKDDTININLLDNSLNLLDKWGDMTLRDLMIASDTISNSPNKYQDALNEMRYYVMPSAAVQVQPLSVIDDETYPLASFPNTINTIGDEFNENSDGTRYANSLNVFQTRPFFNQKAILDLACYGLGFSPIFAEEVDVEALERMYVVGEGRLGKVYPDLTSRELDSDNSFNEYGGLYDSYRLAMAEYNTGALKPNNITGFVDLPGSGGTGYKSRATVHPLKDTNNIGTVTYSATMSITGDSITGSSIQSNVFGIWSNLAGTATVYKELDTLPASGTDIPIVSNYFSLSFDKLQLGTEPTGGDTLIGFMVQLSFENDDWLGNTNDIFIVNQSVIETYDSAPTGINYDTNKQYQAGAIDLRYEAPDVSVKEVVSGILKQHGLLMDIRDSDGDVNIFSYADFAAKKVSKNWQDWSDYFIKVVERDTNFGVEFGQTNLVSLKSPYQGNIFERKLNTSGESKYKTTADIQYSSFKDVSAANSTPLNDSTSPSNYLEFTHKGLGVVESNGQVIGLTQSKVDNDTGILLPPIDYLVNVNYAVIPDGIESWFAIIQDSIRETDLFVLPVDVMRGLDLGKPVFVEKTASVYIIDKIKEYQDNTEAVLVQLIKI